jgi:hypothetical protein
MLATTTAVRTMKAAPIAGPGAAFEVVVKSLNPAQGRSGSRYSPAGSAIATC